MLKSWEDLKARFMYEPQAIKKSNYIISHQATELEQRFFTYIFSRLMLNRSVEEIKASEIDISTTESFSVGNSEDENDKTKRSMYIAAIKAFYIQKPFCFSVSKTNSHWVAGAFVPYEKDGESLGLAEFHVDSTKGIMGQDYLPSCLESESKKDRTDKLLGLFYTKLNEYFSTEGSFFFDPKTSIRREFFDGLFEIIDEKDFKEKLVEIGSPNITLENLLKKKDWLEDLRNKINNKKEPTDGDKENYKHHLEEVEEYFWAKIALLHFKKDTPLITKRIHSSDITVAASWPEMQNGQNCGYCNAYNKALIKDFLSQFGPERIATENELSLERLKIHSEAKFMTPFEFNAEHTEEKIRDLHVRFAWRLYEAFENDKQDLNIVLQAINDDHPLGSVNQYKSDSKEPDISAESEDDSVSAIIKRDIGDSRPGYAGTYYQILYLMNQAWDIWITGNKEARLQTEVPGYGKFDDIVYRDRKTLVVVQAKYNYSEDSSYSFNDWVNPTSHKVSLARYFDSWAFIKHRDLEGKEITSIRFKIVSNHSLSNKTTIDKHFSECVDSNTKKFTPNFLNGNLYKKEILDEIINSLYEHSLTLRRDMLLPQLKHVKVDNDDCGDKTYKELIEYLGNFGGVELIEITDQPWQFILLPFLEDIGEEVKISNHNSEFIKLLTRSLAEKNGKPYEDCIDKLKTIRFNFKSKERKRFKTKDLKDNILKFLAEQESTINSPKDLCFLSSNDQLKALKFIIDKVGNLKEFLSDPSFRITILLGDILNDLTAKDQKLSESKYLNLFFKETIEEICFKNDDLRTSCLNHVSNKIPQISLIAQAKGAKKSRVSGWRESLYPFLVEGKKKGEFVLNDEFLKEDEGKETTKFREELIQKLQKNKSKKIGPIFLQDIVFVGIPDASKKKLNKQKKFIKPALNDEEQKKFEKIMLNYLSEIELDLSKTHIDTLEKELQKKIEIKFATRQEVHFRTYIYSLQYWFRVESKRGPVTYEYVDKIFSEKSSPEYQRGHLVGLTHSHEDKIINHEIAELELLLKKPLKVIDDFMGSSEDSILVINGDLHTGKSELIKLYFNQPNKDDKSPKYLEGEYLFLRADEFKTTEHISAVKARKHIVLVLDDADELITKNDELGKIIAEVSTTKTKLILLASNVKELPLEKDSYVHLKLEQMDFEKFPDKIKDHEINFNGRAVTLRNLPQGLQNVMGYHAILFQVLNNQSLNFVVQPNPEEGFYLPQFGKKLYKVFEAEDVLKASFAISILVRYREGHLDALKKRLDMAEIFYYPEDQKEIRSDKKYYINAEEIRDLLVSDLTNLIIITSNTDLKYEDRAILETREDGKLILIKGNVNIENSKVELKELDNIYDSLIEESNSNSAYQVLVEADYGLGKSRLAYELAKNYNCWSLLVNVKDLQNLGEWHYLEDLLLKLSKLDKSHNEELIRLGIRNYYITIIVDGLDELTPNVSENSKRALDLLFSYPKIIVFSRYEGIRPFIPSAIFALEPFDRKKIADFITSSVKNIESREKALKIAERSGMYELLTIPLHSQMFCQIANQNPTELQVITRTKLYSLSNILAFRKFLQKEGMEKDKSKNVKRVLRRLYDERNFMQIHALRNSGFLTNKDEIGLLASDLRRAIEDSDFAIDVTSISLASFSDSKRSTLQFSHQTWQEYYTALGFISFVMSRPGNPRYEIAQEALGRYLLSPNFINIWKFVVQICQGSVSDCDNFLSIKEFREMMSVVEELYGGMKTKILDDNVVVLEERIDKSSRVGSSVVRELNEEEITFDEIIKGIGTAPSNDYWDRSKIDKKRQHDENFRSFSTKLLSTKLNSEQKNTLASVLAKQFLNSRKDKNSVSVIYNVLQIIYFHKLDEYNEIEKIIQNFKKALDNTKRKDLWDYHHARDAFELVQNKDSYKLDWLLLNNKYKQVTRLMNLGHHESSEFKDAIIKDNKDMRSSWSVQCDYIEMLFVIAQQIDDKTLLDQIKEKLILIICKSGEPSPQSYAIKTVFKLSKLRKISQDELGTTNLILDALLPEKKPLGINNFLPEIIAYINEYNLLTSEIIEKLFTIMTNLTKNDYRNTLENSLLLFNTLPDKLLPLLLSCIKTTTSHYKYLLIDKFRTKIKDSSYKNEIESILLKSIKEDDNHIIKSLAIIHDEEGFIKVLKKITEDHISFLEKIKTILNVAAESLPPTKVVKMLLDIGNDRSEYLEVINRQVFEFIVKHPVNIGVFKGKLVIADNQKTELLDLPDIVIESLKKILCPTKEKTLEKSKGSEVISLKAVNKKLMRKAFSSWREYIDDRMEEREHILK